MGLLEKLTPLFYPKSVAVVGATNNPSKWGFAVLHNLILGHYEGKIYPVNHRGEDILGIKSYPSVRDLPEAPDLTMVCVPSEGVPGVVDDAIAKGSKAIFVISSGFSEVGDESVERAMAEKARAAGIVLAGPNGQGLVCSHSKLFCLMAGVLLKPGPISIVSQSGNVGGTLMYAANYHELGIGKFISSGNEAALKIHDLIRYYGEDPDTRVVLVYVEGLKEGRSFLEACREVSPHKPIILLKGGRTAEGARAAKSHTGAMATDTEIFNAACKQVGVLQVMDLREMFELAITLAHQPLPKSNKTGIVTLGGGWGVLASDSASEFGLDLPDLDQDIMDKLSKYLPSFWSRNNPVDCVATREVGVIANVISTMGRWPATDAMMMLGIGYGTRGLHISRDTPFAGHPVAKMVRDFVFNEDMKGAEAVVSVMQETGKPVVVCSDAVQCSRVIDNKPILFLESNNIVVHATPRDGARVLGMMWEYAQYKNRVHRAE